MTTFSRVSRETLHDFNFISVVKDTVYEATTDKNYEFTGIGHIGAVAVVPVMDNGDVVLIEQYRPIVDSMLLEVVAGRRDVNGEDPADTAWRELKEEVAVQALEIHPLGFTFSSPGFTDEKLMLYVGLNSSECERATPDGIEEELSIAHRLPLREALQMTLNGKIVDAKSIVALWRTAHFLGDLDAL